jgi:hypothetical protein
MQEQAGITRKLPRSGLVQPWVIVTSLGRARLLTRGNW